MQFQSVPIPNPILEKLIAEPGPAALGPEIRYSRLPLARLEFMLVSCFAQTSVSRSGQSLLRAAILLWHDHLEASHSLSQEIQSRDGSCLHGIMHRREPDYGNAKYWFHLVGAHPCFPGVLDQIQTAPASPSITPFVRACRKASRWDPFAFVDACEEAADLSQDHPDVRALQELQEIEFRVLVNHFLTA
jgi:hypothetical protein